MPGAKAPYNFVPLPDRILGGKNGNLLLPGFDTYSPEGYPHTGWLDVTYRTLTPTYTRAAKTVPGRGYPEALRADDKGQPADFFHYGNPERTPVLPGSSLRGMIRGVFEVLTYSRMGEGFFNNQPLSLRSLAAPNTAQSLRNYYNNRFQPNRLVAGVLHRVAAGWELRVSNESPKGFVAIDAQDLYLPADVRYVGLHNPGRPRHQYRPITTVPSGGLPVTLLKNAQQFSLPLHHVQPAGVAGQSAFLIVPGKDVKYRHHYQAVLDPSASLSGARTFTVLAETLDVYADWCKRSPSGSMPRALDNGAPAFAMLNAAGTEVEVIFAGLMMAFRYANSIHDVADRIYKGMSLPQYDMSEAVFGYVGDRNSGSKHSGESEARLGGQPMPLCRKTRVFFEDATTTHATPWLSTSQADSIKIPDVLSSPEPTAVQMYLEQPDHELHHWDTPGAKARGYKRYWHRPLAAVQNTLMPYNSDLGTQKTCIRPVKAEVAFSGRIRFENLSDRELGALLASVHLPTGLAHRFGMGKNLGLGSLEVISVETTLIDPRARYSSLTPSAGSKSAQEVARTLITCYRGFVDCVRRHEQRDDQGHPANNPVDLNRLWVNPRLKALGVLLRYAPMPDAEQTRQVGIDSDQWKNRVRLATPLILTDDPSLNIQDLY